MIVRTNVSTALRWHSVEIEVQHAYLGPTIAGDAAGSVRADSFVIETNIHYPTESRLIWDGVRSFVPICVELAKAGQPNQYGRLVLVFEDGAGFISHYHLLDRKEGDKDVVVEQTKIAQQNHRGAIQTASFDRGFHSDENEKDLLEIIDDVCVLPRHPGQYAARLKEGSVKFHQTRLRHSGIESAIGSLQRGNGQTLLRLPGGV